MGVPRKVDLLPALLPLATFTQDDLSEQSRHLTKDTFLYEAGQPRYICSLLGALYEELHDRPDLQALVLEATWMARRITDYRKNNLQQDAFYDDV